MIAPELGPQLCAESAVIGAGPERSAQPRRGGNRFKALPVSDTLQVGRDQSDAEAIVNRQKPQAEQVESAVQGPDAPIREVADVGGEPEEALLSLGLFRYSSKSINRSFRVSYGKDII